MPGVKTLQQIIDDNAAHPVEALKYQQGELTAAQSVDLSDPSTDDAYRSDRDSGKSSNQAVIDNILTNGTASDTSDDFDVGGVEREQPRRHRRAGYPVPTVPAGFGTGSAGRNPIGVTFVGTAFGEARLLADGYAFEQATKVRQAPSVTNPSMWRCVAGSAFFSPHHCHPGDRMYRGAFASIAGGATDGTTTPGGTGSPTGPASPGAGKPLTSLGQAIKLRLASGNKVLTFRERFGEAGTATYSLRLTVSGRPSPSP